MSPAAVAEGQRRMKKLFNEYVAFSYSQLRVNQINFFFLFLYYFFGVVQLVH